MMMIREWDEWLDGIIDRHLIKILVGSVLVIVICIGFGMMLFTKYLVLRSMEFQMLQYRIEELETQQKANQKDLIYLGDELFRMRRNSR